MFNFSKLKYIIILSLFTHSALLADGWKTITPLTSPRAGASAVVWNNMIYVFGGKSSSGNILKTVERYDRDSGQWDSHSVPDFSEARFNAAAVLFHGKIYLIGGHGHSDILDKVEVYDPVQNLWSGAQKLDEKREGLSAVVLKDRIYVIGGQESSSSFIDEIEWYDKDDDEWEEMDDDLENLRSAHFAAADEDTFYMFGGYYSFSLFKTTFKSALKDSDNEWYSCNSMSEERYYGATAQIGDSIFLIGGENISGKTNLVEIFNTNTGQFSIGNSMPTARSGVTAVTLCDSIYAIGGYNENGDAVTIVEMYAENLTAVEHYTNYNTPVSHIIINGYPNPFNGKINFKIQLAKSGQYELDIYDICGNKVKRLYAGRLSAGQQTFYWSAGNQYQNNVASGVYFLTIRSNHHFEKYKIIYVK